jgi:hypothetical protein
VVAEDGRKQGIENIAVGSFAGFVGGSDRLACIGDDAVYCGEFAQL